MAVAVATSLSLTGCGHDRAALGDALKVKNDAAAAEEARHEADRLIAQARRMPELPPECRTEHRSGAKDSDGYKLIAKKTDNALYAANRQIRGCAVWYDETRQAREPKEKS